MLVVIITGACGSGKTTVLENIKKKYLSKHVDFIHFDELSPSIEITIEWRINNTKKLIESLLSKNDEEKITIVEGMIRPMELYSYMDEIRQLEIHFILLDVSFEERTKRLISREAPRFLIKDKTNLLALRKEVKKIHNHAIIDTSNKTVDEISEVVIKYINSIRNLDDKNC